MSASDPPRLDEVGRRGSGHSKQEPIGDNHIGYGRIEIRQVEAEPAPRWRARAATIYKCQG